MRLVLQTGLLFSTLLRLGAGEDPEYRYVLYDGDETEYSTNKEINKTDQYPIDDPTYDDKSYDDAYDYEYSVKSGNQLSKEADKQSPADSNTVTPDTSTSVDQKDNPAEDVKEDESVNTDLAEDEGTTKGDKDEDTTNSFNKEKDENSKLIDSDDSRTEEDTQQVSNQDAPEEEMEPEKEEMDQGASSPNGESAEDLAEIQTDNSEDSDNDYSSNSENEYGENDENREARPEDEDMDTLYKNYEILSEFYQKYYVDLRILDLTCDPTTFPAPSIPNGRVVKYSDMDNVLLPKKKYRQAMYECNKGFVISTRTSNSLFCQDFSWTGLEPECERSEREDGSAPRQPLGKSGGSECPEDSGCDQECRLEGGDPVCYCSVGFVLEDDECGDVDECELDNGGCEEECINKPGSYICSCPSGYELSEDGHSCMDANECLSNNGHGPCQDTCVNVEGYYYCECGGIPGTSLAADRHSCQAKDLCADQNGGCSHSCHTLNGQSFCSCPQGFELGDDWKTCKDINECVATVGACKGECVNTVGSYTCGKSCPENHVLKNGECVQGCPASMELVSGSCMPACKKGYRRERKRCIKTCETGFRLEGDQCVPECTDRQVVRNGSCVEVCQPDTCGHGACEVQGDQYGCLCDDGFQFLNTTCLDVNECSADPNLCPLGECVNTEGSYYCHCKVGYRNQDGACVDVNECEEGVVCSQECMNTAGSYECRCWEGYTLNPGSGASCSDINECTLRPSICEQGCKNVAGGFECTCTEGFKPDPADSTKCTRAGCQPLEAPEGGRLTCSKGPLQTGSVCTLVCLQGYIRRGRPSRTCLESSEWEDGAGWCEESSCIALPPIDHGVVSPSSCLQSRQQFKQKCQVSCLEGYSLQGSNSWICGKRGKWVNRQGPSVCSAKSSTQVPHTSVQISPPPLVPTSTHPTLNISPYIICPPDILVNLTQPIPFEITIPSPKTNVNWDNDVHSDPEWAKSLTFPVSPGVINIQFSAMNSLSNQKASCKMTIRTIDSKPPVVKNCPNSFNVFLAPGEETKKVSWEEPQFVDNVGVTSVLASQLPGQPLGLGRHVVIYQALDADGNRERCVFSIRVSNLSPDAVLPAPTNRVWVLCRVGNTGRQIRLLVSKVPVGCRRINIRP